MSDVENSIQPIASGKSFPWYLCLMYVYAFGEKHFCMFNANKVFVLYCIVLYFGPLEILLRTLASGMTYRLPVITCPEGDIHN